MFGSPRLAAGPRLEYRDGTSRPGRLEGDRRHSRLGRARRLDVRPVALGERRASRVSAGPLSSPLDVRRPAADHPGEAAGAPPLSRARRSTRASTVAPGGDGGFASLISREKLSAGFVALALLLAIFWGAVHALSPGHGKSIVAAYLVGTRGTPRHAAFLGLIVTVTHTVGVFALGLVTLALSAFIVPEQLYPWLNLASALLVVVVGCGVLRARLRHRQLHRHGHEHDHHHGHHHDHDHELSMRGLLGVGISGGLLPARPRSSCCSRRSRSIASATASSSSSPSASVLPRP